MVVHDLDNRVHFWNREAESLYGWTADKIDRRPIARIMHLDQDEREQAMEVLRNDGIWQRELRQFDRNGDEYLVQVRQHLQRDSDWQAVAIVSFNTDVTKARKLADAAAAIPEEEEERYRDPKSGEGELVLVADDEMFVRETRNH